MNTTKTMRLPPRRLMTSPRPIPRPIKRKEREGLDDDEAHQLSLTAKVPKPPPPPPPSHSNHLLAGYLAHEFLTKGTLFGQAWDKPDPAMASASASSPAEPSEKHQDELHPKNYQSYVEVANLLKHSGPHFQGIVNPTQLARLLNL
ncbi:uncharacterized protein LOC120092519 [Benincasa hispida]|uniref:uncharacterized protein LOC120092519 n=1 Tax=Benincasa hispida TaxID=102211 RepID=UPI0019001D97|nr:uncharacterized protein LOC120092519 [Benincasa hispida]